MVFLIILFVGSVIISALLNQALFHIGSILITCIGIYLSISHLINLKHFKNNGFKAEATIIDIQVEQDKRKDRQIPHDKYKVYISYTTSGTTKKAELNFYSSSMKIGDTIQIYIDNSDHDKFIYAGIDPVVGGIMFSAIGMVLTFFSLH